MDFHKLTIVGVPHSLNNHGAATQNRAKCISFKHIFSVIENFYDLCQSIVKAAQPNQKDFLELVDESEEDS